MPKCVQEEVSFWIIRLEEFSGQPIRPSASILEYYVFRIWQISNWWQSEQEGSRE